MEILNMHRKAEVWRKKRDQKSSEARVRCEISSNGVKVMQEQGRLTYE
jgi:hypothetical protein